MVGVAHKLPVVPVVLPAPEDQLEAAVQKDRAVMKEEHVRGVTSIAWDVIMAVLLAVSCFRGGTGYSWLLGSRWGGTKGSVMAAMMAFPSLEGEALRR